MTVHGRIDDVFLRGHHVVQDRKLVEAYKGEFPTIIGGRSLYVPIQVNGIWREVEEDKRLMDYLRDDLRLTGTKDGCSAGACGACTILIDGKR